nr:hypothetical protein [Candidatus Sigynarchaeota archaeon]
MPPENDDDELAALRRKRMAQLLAQQKDNEIRKELHLNADLLLERKIDRAISHLFTPVAISYFNQLRSNNKALYDKIRNILFPIEVVAQIDVLLQRIQAGYVPRGVISDIDIQQIERELLGVRPSISYKKRGEKERVDIGSLFKGD